MTSVMANQNNVLASIASATRKTQQKSWISHHRKCASISRFLHFYLLNAIEENLKLLFVARLVVSRERNALSAKEEYAPSGHLFSVLRPLVNREMTPTASKDPDSELGRSLWLLEWVVALLRDCEPPGTFRVDLGGKKRESGASPSLPASSFKRKMLHLLQLLCLLIAIATLSTMFLCVTFAAVWFVFSSSVILFHFVPSSPDAGCVFVSINSVTQCHGAVMFFRQGASRQSSASYWLLFWQIHTDSTCVFVTVKIDFFSRLFNELHLSPSPQGATAVLRSLLGLSMLLRRRSLSP